MKLNRNIETKKAQRKALRHEQQVLEEHQARTRAVRRKWSLRAILAVAFVIGGIGFLLVFQPDKSAPKDIIAQRLSHETVDLNSNATWKPNPENLPGVMTALHMSPADPSLLHHHDHLDIYIHGHKIPVPAQVGLSPEAEVPLHTHDLSEIIHIEAFDTNFKPTLGEFFDVWGVSFTEKNIGGYTNNGINKLAVYANGSLYQGDPRQLPLEQHDEIVVTYGNQSELPQPIPSSLEFPEGL